MPILSIIIPIYNAAKHIRKGIDCVLKQSIQDFELILVDDGCTDNSYNICNEYAKFYKHIKLIRQKNQGVSSARNTGLNHAKGQFILFFDSDDTMHPNMAEAMIKLIGTHDIAISGVCKVNENGEILIPIPEEATYQTTHWETIASMYKDKYFSYQGYLWNKLYRRDIIEQYNIRFHEELFYNEDRTFNIEYLLHCKTAIVTTKPYYYYTIWQGSAMTRPDPQKKWTTFTAFEIQQNVLSNAPLTIKQLLAADYVNDVLNYAEAYPQYITECKKIMKNNVQFLTLKMKMYVWLFIYSPAIHRKTKAIKYMFYQLKNKNKCPK